MPQAVASVATDSELAALDAARIAALAATARPVDWVAPMDTGSNHSAGSASLSRVSPFQQSPKKKVPASNMAGVRERMAQLATNGCSDTAAPVNPGVTAGAPLAETSEQDSYYEYETAGEEETEVAVEPDEAGGVQEAVPVVSPPTRRRSLSLTEAQTMAKAAGSTTFKQHAKRRQTAPHATAVSAADARRKNNPEVVSKKISLFELHMEGLASKDDENVLKVNPQDARLKPQLAANQSIPRISKIDLSALPEAPRPSRRAMDPNRRPGTLRGKSFEGEEGFFGEGGRPGASEAAGENADADAPRRAAKPAERLWEEKRNEAAKARRRRESNRPDYARRPGVMRGKSGIHEEELFGERPETTVADVEPLESEAEPVSKKSLAIATDNGAGDTASTASMSQNSNDADVSESLDTSLSHRGNNGMHDSFNDDTKYNGSSKPSAATRAKNSGLPVATDGAAKPSFAAHGRYAPPRSESNEPLPDVLRPSPFGVVLRGTKKGAKLLAGEEIAHRVGGIKLVETPPKP